jgi:hypothetical protein
MQSGLSNCGSAHSRCPALQHAPSSSLYGHGRGDSRCKSLVRPGLNLRSVFKTAREVRASGFQRAWCDVGAGPGPAPRPAGMSDILPHAMQSRIETDVARSSSQWRDCCIFAGYRDCTKTERYDVAAAFQCEQSPAVDNGRGDYLRARRVGAPLLPGGAGGGQASSPPVHCQCL